jgi:hypothetical protein
LETEISDEPAAWCDDINGVNCEFIVFLFQHRKKFFYYLAVEEGAIRYELV